MMIRFVTSRDLVSTLIRFGERDGWPTHAEVVLPDSSLLGAHFDGGVMIRKAGYDNDRLKQELVLDIPTFDRIEKRFHGFLYEQLGKKYDWRAVFGLGMGRDWRDPEKWFCSELVAAALEECGWLPRLSAVNHHISPRDLLLVLSGKVVIKGA
jgi:hypothetical protein